MTMLLAIVSLVAVLIGILGVVAGWMEAVEEREVEEGRYQQVRDSKGRVIGVIEIYYKREEGDDN